MEFETEIHGLPVKVEYTYIPASRGARDSFQGKRGAGIQLSPDEPESAEIESVTMRSTGEELVDLLADRILQQLEIEAIADYHDQEDDYDERD